MLCRMLLFLANIMVIGCVSYQPKPLVPKDVFIEVEKTRASLTTSDVAHATTQGLSFEEAIQLLKNNNPALQKATAEYQQLKSIAEISTPLPNPQLEVGTVIGSDLGDDDSGRVQPLVAFGFTIPLGLRLQKQDALNKTLAQLSFLKLLLEHRSQYLNLRECYVSVLLLERQLELQKNLQQVSQKFLDTTKKLIEAGVTTALDVALAEMELLQRQADLLDTENKLLAILEKISRLLGVDVISVKLSQLPQIPDSVSLPSLQQKMLVHHRGLAILRNTYEVAEQELQLEITKQTPDLTINSTFEGDPGEDKKLWGISFSIPIPVFDRNQQAVAEKDAQRDIVRIQYQGVMSESLASLKIAYQQYEVLHQRFLLVQQMSKKAQQNLDLAIISIQSGDLDFLKYLESARRLQNTLVEELQAETNMFLAWLKMESLIGIPVALLPAEQIPDLPDNSIPTHAKN